MIKKIKLILLFVVAFINPFATIYYVSPFGNDENDGFTTATSFLTIERSTFAVSLEGTVLIRNGIYTKTAPENVIT